MGFPFYKQLDAMDCGSSCLAMITKFYGKPYSLPFLRNKCQVNRQGVSLSSVAQVAESLGLRTLGAKLDSSSLKKVPFPCIIHWNQNHFVILYKIRGNKYYVADPAYGLLKYKKQEFLNGWAQKDQGVVLMFEPTPDFYDKSIDQQEKKSFRFLFSYLTSYKMYIFQLIIGMIVGSVLQLIFPFLTQALVDFGIQNQNLNFIYIVLIAQLMLLFSNLSVNFIRSWILLHVTTRINIAMLSDFFIKLMKLPLSFFDSRITGDLLQRIDDHERVENFMTVSTLNILFSSFNLIVFGFVLAVYNTNILFIYLGGSFVYILWIVIFMRKRRELDFKRFECDANSQNSILELIRGIQSIKLSGADIQKRWEWENIQTKLFQVRKKELSLHQKQQLGAVFINEFTNILVTILVAKEVIEGRMTLGMMMAVSYIIGQFRAPLNQLIQFINKTQDAKISLERLHEVHSQEEEQRGTDEKSIVLFSNEKSIYLKNVNFSYNGTSNAMVLQNINVEIPQRKVTAIVGTSGSGKTTLLKLLLKFYNPSQGNISVGNVPLSTIHAKAWRQQCGAVTQEGFIFSDTIARNIALGNDHVDANKLINAAQTACISDFIESLPLTYNTKIGDDGYGLSQGQKQRILIARALYCDPEYLFFDEATNALDANTEKNIMQNLEEFYRGRTVVVIAHRLSTVKKADQIIVLEDGAIIETGKHEELVKLKGMYYQLVKNQLELNKS